MKKFFLLLTLASSLTAFGQHQRRVLVEEFTNASCPPCAAYNPAFNAKLDANAQFVTPIKYQTNWPGFDPMNVQTQSEVQPRVTYYGVTGVPNMSVSGGAAANVTQFSNAMVQTAWNNLTPVTMTLTHAISATYDTVFVNVSVTSDAALTGNLRLRVAITESDIIFDAPPGTNGEAEFYDVMRKMLPNSSGTATSDFAAGETKNYTFAWPLVNIYNLNSIQAVAWLQNDGTKEVYQSALSDTPNDIPDAGAKIEATGNLAQTICGSTYSPSFNLTNTGTADLTEATIQYRMNNGAWTDYNWTGTLAPGASASVTLPDQTLGASGSQKFEVRILNSNNGIQTNMVDPQTTYTLIPLANSVPYPLTAGFETTLFPPTNWSLIGSGWTSVPVGAYGQSSRSSKVDFYNISEGTVLDLYLPRIDLTNAVSSELTFDHAYTYYVSGTTIFKDRVQVEVSSDCGATWNTVFDKEGDDLRTAPAQSGAYTPTATQWTTNAIDLTDYVGSELVVRFRALSGYGNNFYLDNVNLAAITVSTHSPLEVANFAIQPNPTVSTANLRFTLANAEKIQLNVYALDGALVQTQVLGNLPAGEHFVNLDAAKLANGSYRVTLVGEKGTATQQWLIAK